MKDRGGSKPCGISNSRSYDGFWSRYPGIAPRLPTKERFIESHG